MASDQASPVTTAGPERRRVMLPVLVAVLATALVGVALVAVLQRRDLTATRARADRLTKELAARPGGEGGDSDPAKPAEPGGGDDPLSDLLAALGGLGGGSGGLGGLASLADCASALAGADPGGRGSGLGALFGGGGGSQAGKDPGAQLAEIAAAVEKARGLRFDKIPTPTYLGPAALGDRVRREVTESYTEAAAAADTRVLVALGALKPGDDLRQLQVKAVGDQVAGFYDTRTKELVVASPDPGKGLSGQTRMVLAHELDHALTDQALGLPLGDGPVAQGSEDEHLAALGLVEGDATLTMQLYAISGLSLGDQLSGLTQALPAQQQLASLPHHLQRALTAPYLDGLSFVCKLHAAGGWKAVDEAYRKPPTTSAQLLFPDRYQDGEGAIDPSDPGALPAPWRVDDRQDLGAADLLWLFEAPGGDTARALPDPRRAAGDWGGGELVSWARGDQTAVGVALVGRKGATGLCPSVQAWYQAAFPGGRPVERGDGEVLALDGDRQDAVLRCRGADVRLGIGPDLTTARALAG